MKAYYIDAGEHHCRVDYLGLDLGSIYGDEWFGNVVYAENAAQAKHLFISFNNSSFSRPGFEYTDKMSIRVLAHEGDEKWEAHVADAYDYEESDWMRGRLTGFGAERYEQWLKDCEFIATQ